MQGTVKDFDPAGRSGSVLLDDGSELPFDAAAFDAGGLRLLRSGRRDVEVRIGERVTRARLTEVDPWGGVRITGVGTPPWPPEEE